MATEDPTRNSAPDTASQDRRMERAVLALLLDEHPARLTFAELSLAFGGDGSSEDDAVRRAVEGLLCVGLLHRDGALVGPTRPALYFDSLRMG